MHSRSLTYRVVVAPGDRQPSGVLVPWDTWEMVTDDGITWYPEAHARGSILVGPGATIPVYDDHTATGQRGPLIGEIVELEDRPDGLHGRAVIHRATLPARSWSIEFDALESFTDATGRVLRLRSQLTGAALTDRPQYADARVLAFRSNTNPNTNPGDPVHPMQPTQFHPQQPNGWPQQQTQQAPAAWPQQQHQPQAQPQQLEHHRGDGQQLPPPPPTQQLATQHVQQLAPVVQAVDLDDSHRRAAAAQTMQVAPAATVPAQPARGRFRGGIGEFMHAVANNRLEPELREEYFRALATSTTADSAGLLQEQWITEIVDYIGSLRPFIAEFSSMPLPTNGMTIPYPRITQRATTAKQAAQLDEVSSTKLIVGKSTADVETYAGGNRISLQEVQRSDPSYLALLFEILGEELAIDMDTAAIAAVAAVVPVGNKINISAAAPALNAKIVAGCKKIIAARAPLDLAFVLGVDLWEQFASATDTTGRPLFPDTAAMNPIGSSDPTSMEGIIRRIRFVCDPNMTATKGYLGWRRAYTSMLGGLQTINADAVANLARDEAVFQFGAHLVRRPDAIVEFTLTA